MNRYCEDLREKLNQTRTPVTTGAYLRRLRVLNDDKPIQSMKFLMNYDTVVAKINGMEKAFSTKTSYLTAVCAVLSMYPKYHALYKKYQALMINNANQIKEEYNKNEKNEKQMESIIPMKEVLEIRDKIKSELDSVSKLGKKDWEKYVGYVLLCLYTITAPRRNKDYALMVVCFDEPENMDKDKNYYVASDRMFVFNNYKTKKSYGQQRLPVNEELVAVLDEYIDKYQSIIENELVTGTVDEFPLLVDINGAKVNEINGITRILNKMFGGRNIGSGALRHIFLSEKFAGDLKERKELCEGMAHSLQTQSTYIKL